MVAHKTRFDGQTIVVPEAMRGSPPVEVIVVVEQNEAQTQTPSVWDTLGPPANPITLAEAVKRVEDERRSWDR